MAKKGDTVRFLNSTGGGIISRIDGQIAYVTDEDGFDTPVLLKELVVVMPAGQQTSPAQHRPMFDQKAYDAGRAQEEPQPAKLSKTTPELEKKTEPAPLPIEETDHGDKLNIALAFEPSDVKHLDKSRFSAVLVNDSNYFLIFVFMRRAENERVWTTVCQDTVAPNEYYDLTDLTHGNLADFEKIGFQCIACKKDRPFTLQAPVSITRKLDLTKFHKFHCFRPGLYFEEAVIEVPLVTNGIAARQLEVNASEIAESMVTPPAAKDAAKELSKKFRVDSKHRNNTPDPAKNPHKILPLMEIDLHIGELTDTLAGMQPKDMLELQLDTVRKTMKANNARVGQKIVFIHGKGEGVLRKAVLDLLKKEFPKAELQDASFREYGFGATLVTIH